MTSRTTSEPQFRSTSAFAARARRSAPAIERATFVCFMLGGRRFAAPVESVERVLRWNVIDANAEGDVPQVRTVSYARRDVPLADLAGHLGLEDRPSAASRVLILNVPTGWVAAVVDAVLDVATVDAAIITLVERSEAPDLPRGVRGMFIRQNQPLLVLDVGRALGFRFS
jgi:chemotaxis signal transduction protein